MTKRLFGTLGNGDEVHEITLQNGQLTVQFLTLGARINDLTFDGVAGLTPCFDLPGAVANEYAGVIVGPVMNRLKDARAPLDGRELAFDANENANLLHSGDLGVHRRIWSVAVLSSDSVTFTLDLAPDALPGQRRLEVTYRLDASDLVLEIVATTDAPTLMNAGFHPYWSLSGSGRAGHQIAIAADHYLPMHPDNIPTGEIAPVSGDFDLRESRAPSHGVDHCFVLNESAETAPAVTLQSEALMLEIFTDAPAVHVFTGMEIGIAVEPEIHPDAPNHPQFPSIRLAPGDTFRQRTIHRFSRR